MKVRTLAVLFSSILCMSLATVSAETDDRDTSAIEAIEQLLPNKSLDELSELGRAAKEKLLLQNEEVIETPPTETEPSLNIYEELQAKYNQPNGPSQYFKEIFSGIRCWSKFISSF